MSLIQISESDSKNNKRKTIGIDLGTTNSLVAYIKNGKPEILEISNGKYMMPSIVSFNSSGDMVIGELALLNQYKDPLNTISSVKRLIGKDLSELNNYHCKLTNKNNLLEIHTDYGVFNPIQISSEILSTLKNIAKKTLGSNIFGAVITVPAYFDDSQRQATRDAANIAGINVLRLLNEPTAAAIAYGIEKNYEGLYAIYDLGGGTFDLSILRLSKGIFEVIATKGNTSLGGNDFDMNIVNNILQEYSIKEISITSKHEMLMLAKIARETLSKKDCFKFQFNINNIHIDKIIDNEWLENISQNLIKSTINYLKIALQESNLTIKDIKDIVMVGGATRMPIIYNNVKSFFSKSPLIDIDPDKVVALGAALQADLLSGNNNDQKWLLLDVSPLTLGIEVFGGLVEQIIPRNSKIPTFRSQEFTTFRDGQTSIEIHIVQGERELVENCRSLAKFKLDIPPMPAGIPRITVKFQIDADGILDVIAIEKFTKKECHISVKPSYGLSKKDISNILKDSIENKEMDLQKKSIVEAKNNLNKLIFSLSDKVLLENDLTQKQEIDKYIIFAKDILENSSSLEIIQDITKKLSNLAKNIFVSNFHNSIKNLNNNNID
ncbi:Chaperone protein HscA [Candidatus Kinetoplastibacterium sorsogonicusi]|uniref:Chaperone protein HscA n=1 Tax=Candidatus Kinetoplastidibacterium kentomonadis TaxID=1576550 RepID=A0A3Q8EU54_9PROT|nr:Fe-S protein assembly chaperone HscA [Candidatus Kinetoplastibacterium sorsogonicusi]AWD32364.1 Chaperone protein HscA [Candidatus Kinetoplastibacterium sorsogonicusi]